MDTNRLVLFPHAPDYLRALAEGSESCEAVSGDFLKRLQSTTEPEAWTWGFAVVIREKNLVIGMASFKGTPGRDRIVEIAYGISPAFQGQGYATEAARGLIQLARESGRVSMVCAHTLPTNDPSKRVLEKCGFTNVGEVMDPKDGLVIRWELKLE
jgi:ribosomal-protein-alanine N-acetyltransferase